MTAFKADKDDSDQAIESKEQLIDVLSRGMKPEGEWLIGTEHEKFAFFMHEERAVRPVPFDGSPGIEALLKAICALDRPYKAVYEHDRLIALKLPSACGGFNASITLEPGGQVELSGAPLSNVHQTVIELQDHLTDLQAAGDPLGVEFLGLGYSPKFTVEETPKMPKGRYDIMRSYMPNVGGLGLNMMHCSATVQVNLDFASEADMVKKFQVALALQPFATALFANSVFKDGQLNGFQSFRSEVWRDVDADRTGMLPFVFEDGMGFERYVDYALQVPMYFILRQGDYVSAGGKSFAQFMAGEIDEFKEFRPTLDDWELHLTTLFPEVRLKQFLEMRGADCGPTEFISALSAFWVGMLYDRSVLDAAHDFVKGWSVEQRQQLRDEVPRLGLKSSIEGHNLQVLSKEVLAMAEAGLKERQQLNEFGDSEEIFLEPLHEIVSDGWSQSDRLIDIYKNVWQGDIEQVYRELKF